MKSIKNKRIEVIDSIRGFALFGVILANVPYSNTPLKGEGFGSTINFFMDLLVSQKFITIFSILFGFGFYIQMKRYKKSSKNFNSYFLKRMLVLFLIGGIHSYAFWNGDILMCYALGGVLLLLIRKCNNKQILLLAIIFNILITGLLFIANRTLEWQMYDYDYNLANQINITDSYSNYLKINFITAPWTNFLKDLPITLSFTFGNMLIGVLLGRIHFFESTLKIKRLNNVLIILGFTIGLTSSYFYNRVNTGNIEFNKSMLWMPFVLITGMLLQGLGYMALFKNIYKNRSINFLLNPLQYIGKTALTNYILQSVFYLIVIFHCTGIFQLFGKINRIETYILTLMFFLFQVLNSYIWLKINTKGPIEYLWRKLSK